MAKKVEAPPTMLGILRFDVDTSTWHVSPQVVLGAILVFILIELLFMVTSTPVMP